MYLNCGQLNAQPQSCKKKNSGYAHDAHVDCAGHATHAKHTHMRRTTVHPLLLWGECVWRVRTLKDICAHTQRVKLSNSKKCNFPTICRRRLRRLRASDLWLLCVCGWFRGGMGRKGVIMDWMHSRIGQHRVCVCVYQTDDLMTTRPVRRLRHG